MITERVSQRHGVRYMVRFDYQGRKITIGTYRTQREAMTADRKAKNQIDAGTFVPPSERRKQEPKPEPKIVTVADALRLWIETKRGTVQPNTIVLYESAARNHTIPALGDRDIETLTYNDIQTVVNSWRDAGVGARLIDRCVVNLRQALALQVRASTISHNPVEGIVKPTVKTTKTMPTWTDAQFGRFLDVALADERFAPFWALTVLEGMRRAEGLALRWSDLHWSDDESQCVATINQTVIQDLANRGAPLTQDRAKTKASRRSVQLTSTTIATLKTHRDRQRFERQRLGDLWTDHDLIVTTGIGGPVHPANIGRNLAQIVKRAGVPAVTVHGLRHLAVTAMLRANISPALVAAKIGHTDTSTTTTIYGHLITSDQAAANAAIEAAVSRGKRSA